MKMKIFSNPITTNYVFSHSVLLVNAAIPIFPLRFLSIFQFLTEYIHHSPISINNIPNLAVPEIGKPLKDQHGYGFG